MIPKQYEIYDLRVHVIFVIMYIDLTGRTRQVTSNIPNGFKNATIDRSVLETYFVVQ